MATTQVEQTRKEYLERLRAILRRAPAEIREDALREVQTHIEDEWQALGGDERAMQLVLTRLGPPETYGRDLALQLMLQRVSRHPSLSKLIYVFIFWASTSVLGALLVLAAAMFTAFGLGMLVVAIFRFRGSEMALIDATGSQIFGKQIDQVYFPASSWSPGLTAVAGILPAAAALTVIYVFLIRWVGSRLAVHGLGSIAGETARPMKPGWERRAVLAMIVFALIGSFSCVFFTIAGELIKVGQPGYLSLPQDLFRSPLTFLAFVGGLVFLLAPVLGLLWTARRR